MTTKRLWGFEKIGLSPVYFNYLRLFYALLALKKVKGKVLEVGGGAGAFTRAISVYRPDLKTICTDIEPKLINSAKRIDPINSYKVENLEHLSFKSNTFDAVISFDVIEHLVNPDRAFFESARILKNGGILHFAIPLEGNLITLHGVSTKLGLTPKEVYAGHVNQFATKDILLLLKQSGFKKVSVKYSGHYFYQMSDYLYFLWLYVTRKKPSHTVEGFIEDLPQGIKKNALILVRMVLSFIYFAESKILLDFPGQIGHFTAQVVK